MSKVACRIEEGHIDNDEGQEVDGIVATFSRGGHVMESGGTSDSSKRHCLWLTRRKCPERGAYYVDQVSSE